LRSEPTWKPPFPFANRGATLGADRTADRKDGLEDELNRLVCSGKLSLAEAQTAIATEWIDAYRRHVKGDVK